MAKLTARFDLEDRISKKLRTISGNAKTLERTRSKLNKPMVLKVKDQATKTLTRVHRFVLKDIAKTHTMFVSLKDRATRPLNKLNAFMKRRMPRAHELIIRAQDRTRSVMEGIRRYTNRHLARPIYLFLEARDRAMPIIHRVSNYARRALSRGYSFTVRAIDIATTTVGRIASFARTAIPRYRNFTIRAFDRATRIIGTVKRALFSIPTAITVALAVVGVNKLKDATVGAAMNFEGYNVSMEHWLDGNKKQAQELVTWMGQFADKTPFSSPDLFPALARGVGLAGGNVSEAKQLLTIATNMAALTPGRTVEDAMEALGAAQMGEFQMLKGYNIKMTVDEYDKIGGWEGLINEIDEKFAGGAEKLSETAQGILATLAGYRGSILRSLGEGFLEPMKPRLNAISDWLDNNQETWGRWKKTVQQVGEDASEWVFSKLENGFNYIKTNYLENEDFKKMDFEGKVNFIMTDLKKWWDKTGSPFLQDVGIKLGKAIGEGMIWGFKEGLKGVGGMWLNAFKDPSLSNFAGAGIATALAGSVLSLILTPLFRGISGIFKTGKWFWDQGKKVAGLFGKGKGKGTPPIIPRSGGKGGGGGWFNNLFGRGKKPDYRHPWFNKGAKPNLNVPNQHKIKIPKIPKGLSKLANFGKRIPVLGTLLGGLALATAPKEEKAGVAGGIGGGLAGAAAGAAIGSVVPVVGTTIGGILGGVLGSMGGTAIGDWFSSNWSSIKQGASDAGQWISDKFITVKDSIANTVFSGEWWGDKWDSVKNWTSEKLSDTAEWWENIKETASNTIFSADWWFEQAGFVYGYLESTIFSGDWWSEKWEIVKQWTEGTIFDGEWWIEKWESVMEWTSEKWESAVEIWESVKTAFAETVFSADWWLGKWDSVKAWTQEKWDSAVTIWNSVKDKFAETVFSGDWWLEKWESVKGWTQEKWDSAVTIWNSVKDKFAETVFNSDWWLGKWESVKSWTQSKWDTFTSVWNAAREKINETLFNKEWWSGKWETVKGWASSAWEGIKSMASGLGESFSKGRQKGQQAAAYADGGFITRPHLGLVGEAGPEAIIPLSSNRRSRALSLYERTGQLLGVKPYAFGGIVGNATLPKEQVASVISVTTSERSSKSGGRDIIVQINGDNHYHNDMDAEKVADIAVEAIEKKLEDEYNESGEMVVYE